MQPRHAWRLAATVAAFGLAIAGFSYYFATHPGVGHQLGRVSIGTLLVLFGLYGLSIVALSIVTLTTLQLCGVKLSSGEGFLLTGYSSIINFFGPLQSGPAFRALYLKKRHNLSLKKYASATLLYYVFYAVFNGLLLLSGIVGYWLLLTIPVIVLLLVPSRRLPPVQKRLNRLNLHHWYWLALATLAQVCSYVAMYYVELKSVMPSVHFSQAVSYTGAANFSLFVSLTPGAVGFRESFLLFSQHIHHISSNTIIAANIIDRAVYIVTLLILALVIFGSHARRRLRVD